MRNGADRMGFSLWSKEGLDRESAALIVDWALEQGSSLLGASVKLELADGTVSSPINLRRSKVGAERNMELISENARSIAHGSAHAQIIAAYQSLKPVIERASVLRVT